MFSNARNSCFVSEAAIIVGLIWELAVWALDSSSRPPDQAWWMFIAELFVGRMSRGCS